MLSNHNNQINKDHFAQVLSETCDLLRGVLRPEDYKNYFFSLFMFKAISDTYKDKYKLIEKEGRCDSKLIDDMLSRDSVVVPEGASFDDVLETSRSSNIRTGNYNHGDVGKHIDSALNRIEHTNPKKLENIFEGISFSTEKLGPSKKRNELLCKLLEIFNSLNLSVANTAGNNLVGDAFEYSIEFFSDRDGKARAEYYTKPALLTLLASLLDPVQGDDIGDPTCGSGSLLIKCAELVRQKSCSEGYRLYGQDINSSAIALARMNMFLHGEQNYNLELGNTLSNPKLVERENELLKFDVVASHPPISLKNYGYEELLDDTYNRFEWGMPPKTRADYAFISHMIKTLKPGTGRMAVVVPHGVLFRGTKEEEIRQNLIKDNLLDAVIGLPCNLFFSSSIPSAILIFKKSKTDDNILFIDASRDYLPRCEDRLPQVLSEKHIKKIVSTYEKRQSVDRYAYLASFDEVKENNFNLIIPRYVDTSDPIETIDISTVSNEHAELMNELNALNTKINSHFKNLGFNV